MQEVNYVGYQIENIELIKTTFAHVFQSFDFDFQPTLHKLNTYPDDNNRQIDHNNKQVDD